MSEKALFHEIMEGFLPFGRERSFLETLQNAAAPFGECSIDRFGSLIVHRPGKGRRVMIAAQTDVPTALVTYIEPNGDARFLMTGKAPASVAAGSEFRFGAVRGTVVFDEDCSGEGDTQHMRIRPGSGSLAVSDKGVLCGESGWSETKLSGANCGVAAALLALWELLCGEKSGEEDLWFVFSVGSEADLVSQRGVKCAAWNIRPELGISIEPLSAAKGKVACGSGAVLLLSDEHAYLRRPMRRLALRAAKESGAALQFAALAETSRETALHHLQCQGADALTLAIPTERSGYAGESACRSDVSASVQLIKKILAMY